MEFNPFFPERCFSSLEGSHLDVSCCSMSAGSWNFHSSASFGVKLSILSWLVFAAQIPGVDTALMYFWNMDFSSKLGASGGLAFPIGSAKRSCKLVLFSPVGNELFHLPENQNKAGAAQEFPASQPARDCPEKSGSCSAWIP